MIKITKGKEPREWTAKKKTPDFIKYSPIPELRQALLEEQGYICAYCMRQIPVKDKSEKETSKIEHTLSRATHPKLQLDYTNMVICCPGSINDDAHCDKSKSVGAKDISFSLFNISDINSISYSSKDGTIKSTNPVIEHDINKVLNLNNKLLKANRLQTINGVIEVLNLKKWKKSECQLQLEKWKERVTRNINGEDVSVLRPYCGVVIHFLEKKLKQYD